jgi:hypothetical protein
MHVFYLCISRSFNSQLEICLGSEPIFLVLSTSLDMVSIIHFSVYFILVFLGWNWSFLCSLIYLVSRTEFWCVALFGSSATVHENSELDHVYILMNELIMFLTARTCCIFHA